MRKIISLLFFIFVLTLTGCQIEGEAMPHREIPNSLTNRRALVLTHNSAYAAQFLEQLAKRAGQTYSITIDDLNKMTEYNFAYYNCVLIIERLNRSGSAPQLDAFMQIYNGANNIVLLALDGEYTSPYPLSAVTANMQNTSPNVLQDTADAVYLLLRAK